MKRMILTKILSLCKLKPFLSVLKTQRDSFNIIILWNSTFFASFLLTLHTCSFFGVVEINLWYFWFFEWININIHDWQLKFIYSIFPFTVMTFSYTFGDLYKAKKYEHPIRILFGEGGRSNLYFSIYRFTLNSAKGKRTY